MEQNNILNDSQYGFRKNRRIYLALLEMTEEINNATDNKKASIAVFMDLKKLSILSIIIDFLKSLK